MGQRSVLRNTFFWLIITHVLFSWRSVGFWMTISLIIAIRKRLQMVLLCSTVEYSFSINFETYILPTLYGRIRFYLLISVQCGYCSSDFVVLIYCLIKSTYAWYSCSTHLPVQVSVRLQPEELRGFAQEDGCTLPQARSHWQPLAVVRGTVSEATCSQKFSLVSLLPCGCHHNTNIQTGLAHCVTYTPASSRITKVGLFKVSAWDMEYNTFLCYNQVVAQTLGHLTETHCVKSSLHPKVDTFFPLCNTKHFSTP